MDDEFLVNDEVLAVLRTLPMIVLSNGEVISIDSRTVFFPLSTKEKNTARKSLLLIIVNVT